MDKIDIWIEDRFGTPNTFNRQLLDNFIEFLEKELGYVIKDPDQTVRQPNWHEGELLRGWEIAVKYLKEEYGWVKVKEKSNGEG